MLANWITLSRFPLLLVVVLILYFGSPPLQLAGTALLFLGLMLDTVDGVVGQGTVPFAQHRTSLGRFLVGSTWMRTGYAVSKVVTFCGLALAQAFSGLSQESIFARVAPPIMSGLRILAWMAVVFCVFRGLPVIISSLRRYWGTPVAS